MHRMCGVLNLYFCANPCYRRCQSVCGGLEIAAKRCIRGRCPWPDEIKKFSLVSRQRGERNESTL